MTRFIIGGVCRDHGTGLTLAIASDGAEQRILHAVVELAARDGYSLLTVEKILEAAAVSRASFYQYFTNLDDCFGGAYRRSADALVAELAIAARDGGHPELAVLEGLMSAACADPARMQLLAREGVAAGPTGLIQRDALIASIEELMGPELQVGWRIDVPSEIVIGGVFRFLSICLAEGAITEQLANGPLEWAHALGRPTGLDWNSRLMPALTSESPVAVKCRGHVDCKASSRERILRASAIVVREKGYRAATVADIVAAAHVSRRLFYKEFAGKSAAFVRAYEQTFERTVAACAPAFFSSRSWPERVWDSAEAFTGFLSREPFFAHLGFVECHAIGTGFLPRLHDTQLAFTLFLEEGYRQRPHGRLLSRACSPLTASVLMEAAFLACRAGPSLSMRRVQPLAVYVALAPFIGSDAAGEFVAGKLAERAGAVGRR